MPAKRADVGTLLREAFGREAESVLRCLFYARRADVEGRADIAAVLRSVAEGEISQAFGHLELLEESGDPLAGGGDAAGDLAAEWFESLVVAENVHLGVLRRAAAVGA